jgi:hypothetical protein
MPSHNIDTLN